MSKVQPKVGKSYKIIGGRSGHGYVIGDMVTIESDAGAAGGSRLWRCISITGGSAGLRYSVYTEDLEVRGHSRKERLEYNNEELADIEKRKSQLLAENEGLIKFETDEDEVASLLIVACDTSKPEAERVAAVAAVLRQRAKTTGNTEFI